MIESFFSTSLYLPGLFQISAGDLMAGLVFWPALVCGVRFYRRLTLSLAEWLNRQISRLDKKCVCGHSAKYHPSRHYCLHVGKDGFYNCYCSKFEAKGGDR